MNPIRSLFSLFLMLLMAGHSTPAVSADEAGVLRPPFNMPDINGQRRHVSEWDGKILIVNFWASWCSPCLREIPGFIELQRAYEDQGVQFVGIALDIPDKAKYFAEALAINYPIVVAENVTSKLVRLYGSHTGAIPFTAVVNRKGRIVFTHSGELESPRLEEVIQSLL